MSTSKIAVVQAGSVCYDVPATIVKLTKFVEEAAAKGAQLVLFPEAFIGGYPKALTFGISLGKRSDEGRDEFKQYFESAIEYNGHESDQIAEIAKKNGVILVVGVVERDGGTLYCSVFFYDKDGTKLGKHRKLMPTALERCVWGFGDGSTLPVIETSVGKIGAAICWENYMPLLRTTYYSKGIQIYLAPTVDDREVWLSLIRTIALEGRCFVISACQFFTSADFTPDHPAYDAKKDVLIRGGSCAVDPLGRILLEPEFDCEKIAYIDIDLGEIVRGKFDLDVVGHYARPDVFQLTVNEREQKAVVESPRLD
uniref:CN hydrolase domain-containing protein n=1 Tax=Panagrellus redivivus TaxID=6233 RepID=A0A7E4W8C9_PANRE